MATFYEHNALDALLDYITSQCNAIHLLETYTQGQDRTTILSNSVANATIAVGDFTGPVNDGENRRITFSGKTGVATATSTLSNMHVAIISGTEVLAVTNETTNQQITDTNPVEFNSFYLQASQPTQA